MGARGAGRAARGGLDLEEVAAHHQRPREVLARRVLERARLRAGHQVGHRELRRAGALGDAAQVVGLCVAGSQVADLLLETGPPAPRIPRGLGHLAALVDQHVDALAPADQVLAGPRVAGDHDAAPAALEVAAGGGTDWVVLARERADRDAARLHDAPLLYLGDRHRARLRIC